MDQSDDEAEGVKKAFFIVLASVAAASMVWGADTDWIGGTNNFNNTANWSNGVPSDNAVFASSAPLSVTISTDITFSELTFKPGASSYQITLASGVQVAPVYGLQINNQSNAMQNIAISTNSYAQFTQQISLSSVTITDNGGHINYYGRGGTLVYTNLTNAGIYYDIGDAEHATLINGGTGNYISFTGSSVQPTLSVTAGNAVIINNPGNHVDFNYEASAGSATIINTGGVPNYGSNLSFQLGATAGAAQITNAGSNADINFFNNASAGGARIINSSGGVVTFALNSIAENSTIYNSSGAQTYFESASTASSATIVNNDGGATYFSGPLYNYLDISSSTAGNATITNYTGGYTYFGLTAQAGTAQINNKGGLLQFNDTTSAASATVNQSSGAVQFNNSSVAGNATINQSNGVVQFNDEANAGNAVVNNVLLSTASFFNAANAGNAHLTNFDAGSSIQFNDASNAGNSVLTNNGFGLIQFQNASGGGNAAVVNNGGTFTINNVITNNFSLGSIAGNGTFILGAHTLTTGNDGTDTSVSGTISGSGGSLVKVGTGTLTLSGSNSYTNGTTVSGGTLGINNDNNLGTGGSLTLTNDSTLQTDAGISSSRQVNLNSGGGTVDTNGFNSSLLGTIQGSGALIKNGNGTLTLAGSNTYSGGTGIDGGTLKVGSANALPSSGAVVLANVNGAKLDLNGFNSTIGSLSGGGTTGGDVLLGTSTLTVGTDNTSTAYNGSISGLGGNLIKTGNGTLTLGGNNIFTGSTTVDTGSLNLTGSLRGDAIIEPSATFSNVGTMGGLINRGTVIPGINGVGTLTVADYSGSGTLKILFDKTSFNNLVVTGSATLTGGTLAISGTNTDFVTGRYSVITATSVVGSFTTVQTPNPSYFLTLNTEYTPSTVDVLVHALNFADVAQNGNQQGVASALDAARSNATGNFSSAVQAIYALPTADQVHQAYNQISGDSIASFQNAGVRNAEVFTSQMNERATPAGFDTASGVMAPVQVVYAGDLMNSGLGVGASTVVKDTAPVSSYGLWSRGLGFFDNINGNAAIGSPSSRATTGGFQAGYDFLVADDVLFGFSGGYANTSLTISDRSSSGNSTSVQSGVYASYTPGSWFLNGSMAYTTSSNDMTRAIQFTGVNEQATANFQSRSYTSFIEAGYTLKPHDGFTIEPALSLKDSHLHQDAFTESGAPGFDLSVQDRSQNSLVSALGTRITRRFRAKTSHPFTLGAHAAWQHELADIDNSITAQFAEAATAQPFTVEGTPQDKNAAALGLDGRMSLTRDLQIFGGYSATLSSSQQTHGLFGGVSVKW